jgi:hypothetical protein
MKTTTNTATQNEMARASIEGANEMIKAGALWCNGVQIKEITRSNCRAIFVPGVREIVARYLGCQNVTL